MLNTTVRNRKEIGKCLLSLFSFPETGSVWINCHYKNLDSLLVAWLKQARASRLF